MKKIWWFSLFLLLAIIAILVNLPETREFAPDTWENAPHLAELVGDVQKQKGELQT